MAVGVDEAELAGRHLIVGPVHLDVHTGVRASALNVNEGRPVKVNRLVTIHGHIIYKLCCPIQSLTFIPPVLTSIS